MNNSTQQEGRLRAALEKILSIQEDVNNLTESPLNLLVRINEIAIDALKHRSEVVLKSKEKVLNDCGIYISNKNMWTLPSIKQAMEDYHQQFSSPLSEAELKSKFAEHLGEKELNTTDAYAVEWVLKNLN